MKYADKLRAVCVVVVLSVLNLYIHAQQCTDPTPNNCTDQCNPACANYDPSACPIASTGCSGTAEGCSASNPNTTCFCDENGLWNCECSGCPFTCADSSTSLCVSGVWECTHTQSTILDCSSTTMPICSQGQIASCGLNSVWQCVTGCWDVCNPSCTNYDACGCNPSDPTCPAQGSACTDVCDPNCAAAYNLCTCNPSDPSCCTDECNPTCQNYNPSAPACCTDECDPTCENYDPSSPTCCTDECDPTCADYDPCACGDPDPSCDPCLADPCAPCCPYDPISGCLPDCY